MTARHKAYIYILISIAIWGVAGPVVKYTLGYLDTITFLTLRFGLTSLVLVPVWLFTQRHTQHHFPKLTLIDWLTIIVTGLMATTIQLVLLFLGFEHTTSIEGTLISSMAPIFVALAGHYFLGDHVTLRERVGMLIALVGTLIIVGLPKNISNIWGNVLVLLANLAWTVEAILSKKLLRHNLSPLFLTTFFFLVGFLSITPIYFLTHTTYPIIHIPISGWLGFLYMVFLSGITAYFLFYKGQKTIEASEANTFIYLQPIFATPVAYFWLREEITWSFLAGGVVVGLGIYLAFRRS